MGNGKVELAQLIVGGTAQGCVYGLIALGFVLIYKATEMVNFAQGDLMMLGAFMALTFVGTMGMNYWLGFLLAAVCMAAFGYLLDALADFTVTTPSTQRHAQRPPRRRPCHRDRIPA